MSERFSRRSIFACQSRWGWITDDFSLVCYKRFEASDQTRRQHGPEYPTGQPGKQGYARNHVGQEIICHRSSDINKDGWCVAISFHSTTAEPLRDPLKSIGVFAPEEQRQGSWIQYQKWKMQRHSELLTLSNKFKTGCAKHSLYFRRKYSAGTTQKQQS